MEYVARVLAQIPPHESTWSATMASIRAPPGENDGAARRPSTSPRPLMPRQHRLRTPRPRASDGQICSAVSTKSILWSVPDAPAPFAWSASSLSPTPSGASSITCGGRSGHVPGRLPHTHPRRQHPSEPPVVPGSGRVAPSHQADLARRTPISRTSPLARPELRPPASRCPVRHQRSPPPRPRCAPDRDGSAYPSHLDEPSFWSR
jgi:hypothetical protein